MKKILIILIIFFLLSGCTNNQEKTEVIEVTPSSPSATIIPKISQNTSPKPKKYICNCSKTCSQILNCEEAYFQLNDCGCTKRDNDNDGIPCESICN